MLFTNRQVPARLALEWGLVNRVAPSVRQGGTFVERRLARGDRKGAEGDDGYCDRPRAARRGGRAAGAGAAAHVPRVRPLHEAADQLLEGLLLVAHGAARPGLAGPPLHRLRALRGDERLRAEAAGRLRRGAAPRRRAGRVARRRPGARTCGPAGPAEPRGCRRPLRTAASAEESSDELPPRARRSGGARDRRRERHRPRVRPALKAAGAPRLPSWTRIRDASQVCRRVFGAADLYAADVADPESARRTVADVMRRRKRLDLLVLAAGICRDGVLWKMSDEAWEPRHRGRPLGGSALPAGGGAGAPPEPERTRRDHLLDQRTPRQVRPGQLRRRQGGAPRPGALGRAGARRKRRHRQRRGARLHRHADDRGACRHGSGEKALAETPSAEPRGPRTSPRPWRSLAGPGASHITGQALAVDGGQALGA